MNGIRHVVPARWLALVAIVSLLLTLEGCGHVQDPVSRLSYEQAQAQSVQHAERTLGIFPDGARLDDLDDEPITTSCSDSSYPPPGTPVNVATFFEVVGADHGQLDRYYVEFERLWTSAGWFRRYGSLADGGLAMGSKGDFTVLLQADRDGGPITVIVETPCVKAGGHEVG